MIELNQLTAELESRANSWFPEISGEGFELHIVSQQQRRFSHAIDLRLANRHSERQEFVFVKIPKPAPATTNKNGNGGPAEKDRPRLVPILPVEDEVRWEYAALQRMNEHFAGHGEQRGCPAPIDLIRDQAIVVERVSDPTLSQLLDTPSVSQSELQAAVRSVGQWLRLFHQMPSDPNASARLLSHADLSQALRSSVEYLRDQTRATKFLVRIESVLMNSLADVQSGESAAVCGHGDFGPHNVFVSPSGHITGFDTLANAQTSRFEDLAYFLLLLESKQPLFQPRYPRATEPGLLRQSLLYGYFGDQTHCDTTLAWFETLVALDKWVSVTHSMRRATGVRRLAKRVRRAPQQHFLRARVASCLQRFQHDNVHALHSTIPAFGN